MVYQHQTVLKEATISLVGIHPDGIYLDGTLGGGGHTEALLQTTNGQVVGIDRDPAAIQAAQERLERYGNRFLPIKGCFGDMRTITQQWAPFHGIILDLGVSSPQLDQPDRGFSFQQDGPLDMRMDPDQEQSAHTWLNQVDQSELTKVLREYGEEPRGRRIAKAIIAGRPWHRTLALAQCIAKASGYHNSRTHPATRSFQAIRIAVNGELEQLDNALAQAIDLLIPGGRLGIITFHSLEDRKVKHRFRHEAGRDTPKDIYGNPITPPRARLVQPKGIAGTVADPDNPRARSARLRVLERI